MPNELDTAKVEDLMTWCDKLDILVEAFASQEKMTLSVDMLDSGALLMITGESCATILKVLEQRKTQIRGVLSKVEVQLDQAAK